MEKMFVKILSISLIVIGILQSVYSINYIQPTAFTCTLLDSSYLSINQCKMTRTKQGLTEFSANLTLHQKPVGNVLAKVNVAQRHLYLMRSVIEYNVDVCAFFINKRRQPIALYIYKLMDLQHYSNINHTCPYNHDYILDKLPFNGTIDGILPLQPGKYNLFMKVYAYAIPRLNVSIDFNYSNKLP